MLLRLRKITRKRKKLGYTTYTTQGEVANVAINAVLIRLEENMNDG